MTIDIHDMLDDASRNLIRRLDTDDDAALGYHATKPMDSIETVVYVDQIPDLVRWHALDPQLHGHTLCFLGSSAIGKTDAVRQGLREAAAEMGRRLELHEMHVSQMGPTDVMGVPRDDGQGRTVWYPPRKFALDSAEPGHREAYEAFREHHRRTGVADWRALEPHPFYAYFWDEVTNPSMPSVIHQCFSLWYGNYVADHPLVPGTMHVLAGNRVQDGTNSINLARSAATRLGLVQVLPRFAGWLKAFAMQQVTYAGQSYSRVHPLVIAYLARFSDRFSPDPSGLPQMEPFPSPRTWTYVSDALYAHDRNPLPDALLFAEVAGRIGVSDARNFWAFREHWRELPDIGRMLDSPARPDSAFGWLPQPWPERPDLRLVMGTHMVNLLDQDNAKRFIAFMSDSDKFSGEQVAATMRLLRPAGKLEPLATRWAPKEFTDWAFKQASLMV